MTYSESSIAVLASERHVGQKVQITDRIRWVRMPGRKDQDLKDQIVWWPGILYENFRELNSDLDERLIDFRAKCIQQHTSKPKKPTVAYFFGFVPPLVRTITNDSFSSTTPQESNGNFGLDKEVMDSEVKDFYSSYVEMQKLANSSKAPQKHKEMFNHFVTLAENIISVRVENTATDSDDQTDKQVDHPSLAPEELEKETNQTVDCFHEDIPHESTTTKKLNDTNKDKSTELDSTESDSSRFSEQDSLPPIQKTKEPYSASIGTKVFDVEEFNPRCSESPNNSSRVSHLEVNDRSPSSVSSPSLIGSKDTCFYSSDESSKFSDSNGSWCSFWGHLKNDEGWRFQKVTKSNRSSDCFYVPPNCNPESRSTRLGVHYFNSTEDVIEYCRKQKEQSTNARNANKTNMQDSDPFVKTTNKTRKLIKMKSGQRDESPFTGSVSLKKSTVAKGLSMRKGKKLPKKKDSSVGSKRKRGRPLKSVAESYKSLANKKRKTPSKTKNSHIGRQLKKLGGKSETSVSKTKSSPEAYRWWSSEPIPDWKHVWRILQSKLMFVYKCNSYVLPGTEKFRVKNGLLPNTCFTNPHDMRVYLCKHGIPLHAKTNKDESLRTELEQVVRWVSLAHLPKNMNGRKINSTNTPEVLDEVECLNDAQARLKLLTIKSKLCSDPYNIDLEGKCLKHARSQIRVHGVPPRCQISDADQVALILWSSLSQLPENIIPSTNDDELAYPGKTEDLSVGSNSQERSRPDKSNISKSGSSKIPKMHQKENSSVGSKLKKRGRPLKSGVVSSVGSKLKKRGRPLKSGVVSSVGSTLSQLPENIIPSTNDDELVSLGSGVSSTKRKTVTEMFTASDVSKKNKHFSSGNNNDVEKNNSFQSMENSLNANASADEHILNDNKNLKSVIVVETAITLKKQKNCMTSLVDLREEEQYEEVPQKVTKMSTDEIGDTLHPNKEIVCSEIDLGNINNNNKRVEVVNVEESAAPLKKQKNPEVSVVNIGGEEQCKEVLEEGTNITTHVDKEKVNPGIVLEDIDNHIENVKSVDVVEAVPILNKQGNHKANVVRFVEDGQSRFFSGKVTNVNSNEIGEIEGYVEKEIENPGIELDNMEIEKENAKHVDVVQKEQKNLKSHVCNFGEEKASKEISGKQNNLSCDEIGDAVHLCNTEKYPSTTLCNFEDKEDDKTIESVEQVETAAPLKRQTNTKFLLPTIGDKMVNEDFSEKVTNGSSDGIGDTEENSKKKRGNSGITLRDVEDDNKKSETIDENLNANDYHHSNDSTAKKLNDDEVSMGSFSNNLNTTANPKITHLTNYEGVGGNSAITVVNTRDNIDSSIAVSMNSDSVSSSEFLNFNSPSSKYDSRIRPFVEEKDFIFNESDIYEHGLNEEEMNHPVPLLTQPIVNVAASDEKVTENPEITVPDDHFGTPMSPIRTLF